MFKSFPKEILRTKLPDLNLVAELNSEWGALRDNHRLSLHTAVEQFREFSISHAPEAGGFVAVAPDSSRTLPVGFDIEVTERVKAIVVKRVMNDSDDVPLRVPQSLIWSAKEAAFKSMKGPNQPPVISEIMTFAWKRVHEGLWEFSYAPKPRKKGPVLSETIGVGLAWLDGNLQFSVCIRTRQ